MTLLAVLVALLSTYGVATSVFNKLFPQLRGFSRVGLIGMGSLVYLLWASFLSTWLFGFEKSYWVLAVVSVVPRPGVHSQQSNKTYTTIY